MKKQTTNEANVENNVTNETNVENNVTNETNVENNDGINENLSPEMQQAQRILRAKLPALSARSFNFEKRTGSVFTATMHKIFDESGQPVLEMGVQKEKYTRSVVQIEDPETGELLPEFADIAEDLKAKRCAAIVMQSDTLKEKRLANVERLEKELDQAKQDVLNTDVEIQQAIDVVMIVKLPEHIATQRDHLTAKLTEVNTKMEKMIAMLKLAGFTDAEIEEQING